MGLGMPLVAKADQSTGSAASASYVCQSNELVFAFTAPYSRKMAVAANTPPVIPGYNVQAAHDFIATHGLAVRAVGVYDALHFALPAWLGDKRL